MAVSGVCYTCCMSDAHPKDPNSGRTRAIIVALSMVIVGGLLVAAGLGMGFWFATHYRVSISPRESTEGAGSPESAPASSGSWRQTAVPSRRQPGDSARDAAETVQPADGPLWPLSPSEQHQGTADGPFAFQFTRDETLHYRVASEVSGKGLEGLTESGVLMDFESAMRLETRDVDQAGNALLRMTFDESALKGSFMDESFSMEVTPGNARVSHGDRTPVDTRQGVGSTRGIPQLEFLQEPVDMVVAPNGQVLKLSNSQNIGAMLTAVSNFSTLEFPSGEVVQGQQWESRITLPVPGFGTPAAARIINTFVGYEQVKDRLCGVIEQQFVSEQVDGTLNAPESALGEALGLNMPVFQLAGENRIYFDTTNGQLVLSDMDLDLRMDFAQMLGDLSPLLGGLLTNPDALLGGSAKGVEDLLGPDSAMGGRPQLSLDLDIVGTMELME